MTYRPLAVVAFALVLAVVAPSAFFAAPPPARAIDAEIISNTSPTEVANTVNTAKTTLESTFSAIKNAVTAVSSVTSAAANIALQIDKYVLEPLAFVMSGNLLKSITAGVLDFIKGKTNGTGVPQFVTDLRGNIVAVSDVQANAFFNSFARNSDSPFAAAITSSLRTNYLEQTSLAGFYAANRDTLRQFSPNEIAYLGGTWSQGGIGAWFALTTHAENNPYLLHPRAQRELATLVAQGTTAQLNQLAWNQGFLSWCGSPDSDSSNSSSGSGGIDFVQVTPQQCLKADGTPGVIQTPGSTIKSFLDKTLGSTIDKLASLGSLGPDVNNILGNVATVFQTINFATSLLGGSSGGLLGSPSAPAGNGYFGLSPTQVQQNGAAAAQQYQNQANTAAQGAAAAHDAQTNPSSPSSPTGGGGTTVSPTVPVNTNPLP